MFLHTRHDFRLQETAAGRRFLQTLRQSQEEEKQRGRSGEDEEEEEGTGTASTGDVRESPTAAYKEAASSSSNTADDTTLELKSSLEKLIVEYLKKLSPEEDFEAEEYSRLRRHLMEIVEPTIDGNIGASAVDGGGGDNESAREEEMEEDEEDVVEEYSNEIVTENVSSFNTSASEKEKKGGKRRRPVKKCVHSRRLVTSLTTQDLDRAQQNETDKEYNIRRIINYRYGFMARQFSRTYSKGLAKWLDRSGSPTSIVGFCVQEESFCRIMKSS